MRPRTRSLLVDDHVEVVRVAVDHLHAAAARAPERPPRRGAGPRPRPPLGGRGPRRASRWSRSSGALTRFQPECRCCAGCVRSASAASTVATARPSWPQQLRESAVRRRRGFVRRASPAHAPDGRCPSTSTTGSVARRQHPRHQRRGAGVGQVAQGDVLEVEDGGVDVGRMDLEDVVADAGVEVPLPGQQRDRPDQAVDLTGHPRDEVGRILARHAAEHRSAERPGLTRRRVAPSAAIAR